MKSIKKSIKLAYSNQDKHHHKQKIRSDWMKHDTVDYWRHNRMYKFLGPLLIDYPKHRWLTIGDGRYGHEAHYIEDLGGVCLATDLSTSRLKIAKSAHYIKQYKKENAEKLSFKENSFDFVLCKESYHHLPRPTLALYEMLRVAKKAVVLIEPNDVIRRQFNWKQLFGIEVIDNYVNKFETSGNYVYGITRREIEKVALGLGLPEISFAGFDDIYIQGVEEEPSAPTGPLLRIIKIKLWLLNILYLLGLRDRSLLSVIIWKTSPSSSIQKYLSDQGYTTVKLPRNPFA